MYDTLKRKRKQRKLSQQEMANVIGCSHRQFRRYENGECPILLDHAILWSKALGLTLNQFVKKKEE